MGLFSIFLYTFTINCVTTGARNKPIEYMCCFIYSRLESRDLLKLWLISRKENDFIFVVKVI